MKRVPEEIIENIKSFCKRMKFKPVFFENCHCQEKDQRIKELEEADFKHREMFTHILRLIEIGISVDSERTVHNMVSKHLKETLKKN